jgi:3-isopropylmalate dehydrogenase
MKQPERAPCCQLRQTLRPFSRTCALQFAFPNSPTLRPCAATSWPADFNILCVRELTGGLYFGQPKYTAKKSGDIIAIDTMVYRKSEIVRIAHVAFKAAQGRSKQLTSVDKANVLENSVLWRKTINEVAKAVPGRDR